MSQQEEQEYEPIFSIDDTHVVEGWEKVNPKNTNSSIPMNKVQIFLKYVFENSKDELEMELQQDTDYNSMILDYLEEKKLENKKFFTLEELVSVLNWAVDTGDEDNEEDEEEKQSQNKEKLSQMHDMKTEDKKVTQRQVQEKTENQKETDPQEKQSTSQIRQQNSQDRHQDPQVHHQKTQSQQQPNHLTVTDDHNIENSQENLSQKSIHPPNENENTHTEKLSSTNSNHDEYDWGKVSKPEEQINLQLYKQINSYQDPPQLQQSKFEDNLSVSEEQNLSVAKKQKHYYKQPLSIKRSLAKLNKSRIINDSKHIVPVLKLDPKAPEMRYLKKHKIVLKNKKAKPEHHPQKTGLQQLFKFYCNINSDVYSINKHKDPAKGTFDELEKRMTNLYMHNFMLLCKDFNIIENKMISKANMKNTSAAIDHIKENKEGQIDPAIKRRNSKGSVPESFGVSINVNEKSLTVQVGKKSKVSKESGEVKDVWDRDKLSNYFKKEADYTLNVKFDKFIQIMKIILKDKLIIQNQETENQNPMQQNSITRKSFSESVTESKILSEENREIQEQGSKDQIQKQDQKQQERLQSREKGQTTSKNIKIDPEILAISKFFKVDTEQRYDQTFKKIKIQYKIMQPPISPRQQRKQPKQSNGQFQQDIAEALKARQLQKQKRRIQVKEKYLSKFSAPQIDSYSSFKTATNQVNNLNSLYGSSPKLITNKTGKCSTVSEGTFSPVSYDMRKKNSGEYKINMGSIIKDARNEVSEVNKENRQTQRLKEHSHTQNLAKSRFNPLNSLQNSPKPILGYKKLHDLRQLKEQEETLSSILLNKSRLMEGNNTNRSQKTKQKTKDISSPLLQRMGCHEDDDLLNKYFDQEKQLEKSNVKLGSYMR